MARQPVRPGRTSFRLGDRLRDLRGGQDLTDDETRRLDRILVEADRLPHIDLDDFIIVHDPRSPGPGEITEAIKPRDLSALIGDAMSAVQADAITRLHDVTGIVMERLKEKQPGALPGKALDAGQNGADLPINASAFTKLVQVAAIAESEGQEAVIWDDGLNQIVVYPGRIKTTVTEGRIDVEIPVAADNIKAKMTVPFATGTTKRVSGIVMATLERPAGHALVARIWGDALIALAHRSVISVVESLAGASGRDKKNNRLSPRALTAKKGQLTIQSQARFAVKRGAP